MKGSLLTIVALLACATASAASPLADAIQNGQRAVAQELIAGGADVNVAQGDGATPLHWAVYRLDVELVELLLDRGANADVANRYGSSPLAEAVKAGNAELVALLLDAGADVDSPNLDGQTTLMLAARTGSVEVAKLLLDAGADVNARESWREQTALMWAAGDAFPEIVRILLEHGADPKARAAANDWDAQITSEPRAQYRPTGGLTPLLYAARAGCADCARAILAAGEDVDRPTPDGVTALMLALDNYEFDTAMALLDEGANPHHADWWGRTALYLAVDMNTYVPREAAYPRSQNVTGIDVVRRLLAAGVETDPQLNMHRPGRGGNSARFTDYLLTTGATPLLRAAITHDDETMRELLEAGAQGHYRRRRAQHQLRREPLARLRGRRRDREQGHCLARDPACGRRRHQCTRSRHAKPHGAHRAADPDHRSRRSDRALRRSRSWLGARCELPRRTWRRSRHRRRARQIAAR
jgi:ankyrin repeat protein